jgi:hypothetical protein
MKPLSDVASEYSWSGQHADSSAPSAAMGKNVWNMPLFLCSRRSGVGNCFGSGATL